MTGNRREKRVYRSMAEFEKEFFPKSYEKKRAEGPVDAQALGISLAKESLDRIKKRLAK